jgi:hypothetical protein
MRTALLMLVAALAFGQTAPTCPVGFELSTTAPVCLPKPPAAPPTPVAPAPSEPAAFYTIGGGVNSGAPVQPFGYYSLSQRLSTGLYTTEVYEFAHVAGAVASCSRAGLSKVLHTAGFLTIGVVGDAGACETSVGSAGAAIAERGFLDFHVGRSAFHIITSGELLKIAGTGQQAIVTVGIGYGK